MLEISQLNDCFENAPSSFLRHSSAVMQAPNDFYMVSEQNELDQDIASIPVPPGFKIRLADFGTGKLS